MAEQRLTRLAAPLSSVAGFFVSTQMAHICNARPNPSQEPMITLHYALSEEDHLQLQLYVASTSERIVKRRKRSRWLVPGVYVVLALLLAWAADMSAAVAFLLVAVAWFLLYPKWEKRRYRKHFLSFVQETYQNTIGVPTTLELEEDAIHSDNKKGSSTFLTNAIMGTDEIASFYYLRVDKGVVIAIPKRELGEQATAFAEWLAGVEQRNNITRNVNLNWQWK